MVRRAAEFRKGKMFSTYNILTNENPALYLNCRAVFWMVVRLNRSLKFLSNQNKRIQKYILIWLIWYIIYLFLSMKNLPCCQYVHNESFEVDTSQPETFQRSPHRHEWDEQKQLESLFLLVKSSWDLQYGNTGCGVFKQGIQN